MKKLAVRNIRLCTKDCLCLYVCPTGATNTENSICADSCPSGAISMVPLEYPPQQPKSEAVVKAMRALAKSKAEQESAARSLAARGGDPVLVQLAEAMEKSNRLMAEDILREAGYMLPQSRNVRRFLQSLLDNPPGEDFPGESVRRLLDMIHCNEVQ